MNINNNTLISDSDEILKYEGYSLQEMDYIVDDLFASDCPVAFQALKESEYKEIPLLNQIQYIIELIREKGRLKLTAKGFFPTKIVADIYHQGFVKDYLIEEAIDYVRSTFKNAI